MATQNRRIAAYLPSEIDQKLKAFKIEAGLATKSNPTKNDSQALIAILTQFFGLNHELSYSSTAELRQQLTDLETRLERLSTALTEKITHLENDLADLKQPKPDIKETEPTQPKSESGAAFSAGSGHAHSPLAAPIRRQLLESRGAYTLFAPHSYPDLLRRCCLARIPTPTGDRYPVQSRSHSIPEFGFEPFHRRCPGD